MCPNAVFKVARLLSHELNKIVQFKQKRIKGFSCNYNFSLFNIFLLHDLMFCKLKKKQQKIISIVHILSIVLGD